MRKPFVLLPALCLILISFSAAAQLTLNVTSIINLAKNIAVLHRNAQDRVSGLTAKMASLSDKIRGGGSLSREDQATLTDMIEAGETIPRSLAELNTEMARLRGILLQQNFSGLDDKFTAWNNAYEAVNRDGMRFRAAARAAQKAGSGAALAGAAQEAMGALALLNEDLAALQVRFQIIANQLEILQHAGARVMPPSNRALGETFGGVQ